MLRRPARPLAVAAVLAVVALTSACAGQVGLGRTATHVIFTTKEGSSTFQLWRMRLDGTERQRLTDDPTAEHHWPRPSPDGTKVLFYRADPGQTVNDVATNSLWVMDPDGTDQRELIPRGAYGWTRQAHAEWSPDGSRIVMAAGVGELQLWTTDAQGRDPRLLVQRRNPVGAEVTSLDPSWEPDGRHVLFAGCPRDAVLCWWWDYEVFRLDVVTGEEERLTDDDVADFDPYVSPDGSTMVWLRCTGTFPAGPWGLYRAPAGQVVAGPVPVIDDGQVNSNAVFSPDGSTLLFSRHVFGGPPVMSLSEVRLDGTGLAPVGEQSSLPADEGGGAYWAP